MPSARGAASTLDYGQERLYADMARAFVHQASADYAGMAGTDGPVARRDDDRRAQPGIRRALAATVGRSPHRIGSVRRRRGHTRALAGARRGAAHLQPALAWLEGWLVEQRGTPEDARSIYEQGEKAGDGHCPVYAARLALAHGRLLRRRGNRRAAVDHLRRAHAMFAGFMRHRSWPRSSTSSRPVGYAKAYRTNQAVQLTSRENEVAHLVSRGLTDAEVAAELFITPKTVESRLGNIYAKLGLKGRQQLRRLISAQQTSASHQET